MNCQPSHGKYLAWLLPYRIEYILYNVVIQDVGQTVDIRYWDNQVTAFAICGHIVPLIISILPAA